MSWKNQGICNILILLYFFIKGVFCMDDFKQMFEDKRTVRHLRNKFVDEKVFNDKERFRDFKNVLIAFVGKYADYLDMNYIVDYLPSLIKEYNFKEYCDILINNL